MHKNFTETVIYFSKKTNENYTRNLVQYELDFTAKEISHSKELNKISEAIFSWEFENDNVILVSFELKRMHSFDEWPIKLCLPDLKISGFCHICREK